LFLGNSEAFLTSNSGGDYPVQDEGISALKIQLLTNQFEDYAIRLKGESRLLAVTNPNVEYTVVIAESDYFKDFEYNWKYTLNQWIAYEKRR
jgi:hypothetical protein